MTYLRKYKISQILKTIVTLLLLNLTSIQIAHADVIFRAAAQNAINTIPATSTISYIGSGSSDGDTGCTDVTPSVPTGPAGDLLIAIAMGKEEDGGNNVTMITPGWNTYYAASYSDFSGSGNNNEMQVRIFWKFSASTEPATVTIRQSGSDCNDGDGSGIAGQISRFRGVDSANPFETALPGVDGQNSNNLDTGEISTTSATAMLIVAGFISDNRNVDETTGPASNGTWSEAFDFDYGDDGAKPDLGISLHYQPQTTIVTNKSISDWELGGTDQNIGAILGLRPSALVGPAGLTINVPAGTVEDDVMIASIAARPSTLIVSPPVGWTLIRQVDQPNANSSELNTYYRVATASEPTDYTWTFAGGFTGASGGIVSFSGVDTTPTPIDAELGQLTNGTSHTAPDIAGTDGGMLVTIHEYTSSRAWTPPGGMAEAVDVSSLPPNNALGIAIEINYESLNSTGNTGTRTASISGDSDRGATQSISLLPAPPPPPQLLAYYPMDASSWLSDPTVVDLSGNGHHGMAIDGINTNSVDPAHPGSPGTCRYAEIPENNDDDVTEAVDTNVNVTNDVGDVGTISFWYRSNDDWDGDEDRQLVDATSPDTDDSDVDKYFYLVLRDNSQLQFGFEDSSDAGFELETGDNDTILADEWVHIAITWDLPNNTMQIYINGNLAAEDTTLSTSGILGALDTIYLGDNRSTYFDGDSTDRSANGAIDEARIYNFVQTPTQIQTDRDAIHDCTLGGLDRFDIIVPTYGSVCNTNNSEITIIAKDFLGNTIDDYTGLINLTTSNNRGDWSLVTGNGTLNNFTADDGAATYQFVASDDGIVKLDLEMDVDDDVSVTVLDASAGISSTSAEIDFRRGNRSLLIATDPIQVAGRPQAMTVARLNNSCNINTGFNANRNMRIWIMRDVDDPGGIAPSITISTPVSLPSTDPGSNNFTNPPGPADNRFTFINGVASFNLDTTDVGKYILNIRDGDRRGSSDSITTRPFGFAFTTIENAGATLTNPRGTATAGNGFVAAEENFSASVGAYLWQSADDNNVTGGDGIPDNADNDLTNNGLTPAYNWDTALSAILHTPAAGTLGNVSPATVLMGTFSGGQSIVTNMNYDEVGSIILQADASNFLNSSGVDITGTSRFDNSTGASAGVVGRFYPDHFTLASSNVTASCITGTVPFTYMNEPALDISYNLEARGASNGLTTNYDAGGYTTGTITLRAEDSNDGIDLGARLNNASSNWANGAYAISTLAADFSRDVAPDGPYSSLQLGLDVTTEQDNRDIAGLDMNPATNDDCTDMMTPPCTSKSFATTDVRFGQLRLNNAFGSELVDITMAVSALQFNSAPTVSAFVTNTDDNCTALTDAPPIPPDWGDINLSNYQGRLVQNDTTPSISAMVGGQATLTLTAPLINNEGSVLVTLDAPPYLEFNWDGIDQPILMPDGDLNDDDPSATATFGIYRGNDSTIYFRELY